MEVTKNYDTACMQVLRRASMFVDLLTPQQRFYFLRGVLFQYALEHDKSVMEYEDIFIPYIHIIARANSI